MMKIAHISDLHLTTFFSQNNLDDIELSLQYINELNVDHIVITGDLTDNADPKDFFLLRNLFDKYNLLYGNRLSIVIGNHDIFGGVQTAEDIFAFPEKCNAVDYKEKVDEFYNYFPEAFEGCSYISAENKFPYAKVLGDVLFVGLNSIAEYSRLKNPFASNGKISLQQFIELVEILDSYKNVKHKIILIHHYFNQMKVNQQSNGVWQNIEKQTMKLRKKKRLFNLFNQYNIDLVLHGHYHNSEEYFRRGIRFSNAGASFKGRVANEININMVSIKNGKIEIEIHKIKTSDKTTIPVYSYNKFKRREELKIAAVLNN